MSDQVILSILFHAKPERAVELGSRLNALAKLVRNEPGSVHFNVHYVNEDQTTWLLYEVWQSNLILASTGSASRHLSAADGSTSGIASNQT
jgi:quinol monooxygenase YgiN